MRPALLLILAVPAFAQEEPAWTPISTPQSFNYRGAPDQPRLGPTGPYEFLLPGQFLEGPPMADQLGCKNNQYAPPFWYGAGQALSGPRLVDNPAVGAVHVTDRPLRGVAFTGTFVPGRHPGVNGGVFYSENPCYMGSLEYGFNRRYDVDSGYTQFYYSRYANCPASGPLLCHSADNSDPATVVRDCSGGINLPAGYAPETPAGHDPVIARNPELYAAWVFFDPTSSRYKFHVRVADPVTREVHWNCVIDPSAANPFASCPGGGFSQSLCGPGYPITSLYNAPGAITVTLNSNNDALPAGRPVMHVERVLAAFGETPALWTFDDALAPYFDPARVRVAVRGPSDRFAPGDWALLRDAGLIAEAKAAGVNPILVAPLDSIEARRRARRLAREAGVPFLDITHAVMGGADATSTIAGALKGIDSPLAAWLSEKGRSVERYPRLLSHSDLNQPEPRDPRLPTLFLIGDSTVRNGRGDGSNGQWGWGEPFAERFDPAKVNVVNRAVGGLSSRTYISSGQWERTLATLKPGDAVLMQFGHNDSGPVDDPARARGTLGGVGEETEEIDNPVTGREETVHTYGWYMRRMIAEAKAKGATVAVCSPVPRNAWKDGKVERSPYREWAMSVAKETGAGFIDLNAIVAAKYDALGPEKVATLFVPDRTHTLRAGAELNATSALEQLPAPFSSYVAAPRDSGGSAAAPPSPAPLPPPAPAPARTP